MKKYTTYQIMNQGLSISPDLNRDDYFKEKWIKLSEFNKLIKALDEVSIPMWLEDLINKYTVDINYPDAVVKIE